MRRRRLLARLGTVGAAGLAGCVLGSDETPTQAGSDGTPSDDADADDRTEGETDQTDRSNDTDDEAETGDTDDGTELDWPSEPYADYRTTELAIHSDAPTDPTVLAAIADTSQTRYRGLSDAAALPDGAGMLFVFARERENLTFVMREMDFGIDIVYADADGVITRIHHAPAPGPDENGNQQQYPGAGKYVLEVPRFWTSRNLVETGDRMIFEL
ncbi:DUF192 domain-containing protein [Halobacteriales archaeon QH_10_67_13]|nr:MAG: DUF192 domain-containing protein [Halobacteriales archaeon QH_10_67_13]